MEGHLTRREPALEHWALRNILALRERLQPRRRAPTDVDLGRLEPGGKIVVRWRGAPIVIINGPAAT
jgi:hypothetical protein